MALVTINKKSMCAISLLKFKERYDLSLADGDLVHGADIVRDLWLVSSDYAPQISPS